MTKEKATAIKLTAHSILSKAVSSDYTWDILNEIINDVQSDVDECADPELWNEDDVRLAIGRVLVKKVCNKDV